MKGAPKRRRENINRYLCAQEHALKGRKMKKTISLVLVLALALAMAGLAQAGTITIGPGADYDFDTIQAGIDVANDADTVLVAPGEHVITEPITFRGKAITVQSEAGPDHTTIRMGTPADPDRASVVVFENNETTASVLDGFKITGSRNGTWFPSDSEWGGGGILFVASSGTVRNCIIVQNSTGVGGGVFVWSGSSTTLTNCVITKNSAGFLGGGVVSARDSFLTMTDCIISGNTTTNSGGGAVCWYDGSLTLTNCIVRDNSAENSGGGLVRGGGQNSSITMIRCTIMDNTAQREGGGGMDLADGSGTLTNCVIARNTAGQWGGGLLCVYPGSSTTVNNCTIWGNSAGEDGGGLGCYQGASATVTNSISSGNTSPKGREISVQDPSSTLTIAYSNLAGGQADVYVEAGCTLNWGAGNIDADPLFAEPGYWADLNDPNIIVEPDDPNAVWIDGDYHLKSEAGRWTSVSSVEPDPNSVSWVLDDVTSPCIDRGDPNSPVGDEPMPNGGIINMGAYGGTRQASMSVGPPQPLALAHWKLDETEGNTAHDSVRGDDAFVIGDALWQPTGGQVDGALQLDGVDDCVITGFVLNPADGAFSVLIWVKGGAPGQAILSQAGGSNWLCTDSGEGNLMTELAESGQSAVPLLSETIIVDGNWHRVGFVWDGLYRMLYVDDVLVAEDVQDGLNSSSNGLYIGTDKAMQPGTYWAGLIDDVRIYPMALNADQIDALAR